MNAVVRRLAQGLRALLAFATTPDLPLARQYLTNCEYAAFLEMSRAEQLHSLNVLRAVLKLEPAAPPALTAAALLHDVGKSRYRLAVWQKTLSVLVLAFAPPLDRQLSHDESIGFWRAPFAVRLHHPKWSAEILRKCGSDPAVIWLAEHHQAEAQDYRKHAHHHLLTKLQSADSAS